MHLKNKTNLYQEQLGPLFDEMPKSVLAAIAVSALTIGGDYLEEAPHRLAEEWRILFENGIVSQRPGKHARRFTPASE
jgi:hypothetical protein